MTGLRGFCANPEQTGDRMASRQVFFENIEFAPTEEIKIFCFYSHTDVHFVTDTTLDRLQLVAGTHGPYRIEIYFSFGLQIEDVALAYNIPNYRREYLFELRTNSTPTPTGKFFDFRVGASCGRRSRCENRKKQGVSSGRYAFTLETTMFLTEFFFSKKKRKTLLQLTTQTNLQDFCIKLLQKSKNCDIINCYSMQILR